MAQKRSAPPEAASDRDAARALAIKGLKLLNAKKYPEAIDHFEKAEARFHAPTHSLFIARAHRQMGKWLLAKKHYRAVLDENIPNYAPDAFHKAQTDAGQELAALEARLPKFKISVQAAAPSRVDVRVDGQRVDWQAGPVEADPGEHVIDAAGKSGNEQSRTLRIQEGEVLEVRFAFSAEDSQEPGRTAGAEAGPIWPAGLAFGVGALGIGAGVALGYLSFSKVDQLKAVCPNNHCAPSAMPMADDARFYGNLSTVGFIVGAAGAVAGTVLIITRPGGSKRADTASLSIRAGFRGASFEACF